MCTKSHVMLSSHPAFQLEPSTIFNCVDGYWSLDIESLQKVLNFVCSMQTTKFNIEVCPSKDKQF